MDTCVSCGHELVSGRFCTNCGRLREAAHPDATAGTPDSAQATRQLPPVPTSVDEPDDWRTDTAERPAARHAATPGAPPSRAPSTPPPAPMVPGDGPRFPLFADQVAADDAATSAGHPTAGGGTAAHAPVPPAPLHDAPVHDDRGPRRRVPWAAGAAVLLLVLVLGSWLVVGGDGAEPPAGAGGQAGQDGNGAAGSSGGAVDVVREATPQVPATAPPNQDLQGNMVRYEARNMLDGVPTTCWRMAGDGTGEVLTFDLARPTTLTTVGLVNGYAKTANDARGNQLDWYHGNRRVLAVEWTFDDGTSVTQDLRDTRSMQTMGIDPVTTRSVQLRLVSVSAPGTGRAARNYTPISDVTLQGTPG